VRAAVTPLSRSIPHVPQLRAKRRKTTNEYDVSRIELRDEMLEQALGGLTSSQVGQRGDALPPIIFEPARIGTPQAYRFWTGGGWHGG